MRVHMRIVVQGTHLSVKRGTTLMYQYMASTCELESARVRLRVSIFRQLDNERELRVEIYKYMYTYVLSTIY